MNTKVEKIVEDITKNQAIVDGLSKLGMVKYDSDENEMLENAEEKINLDNNKINNL